MYVFNFYAIRMGLKIFELGTVSIPTISVPLFTALLIFVYVIDINYYVRIYGGFIYGKLIGKPLSFLEESITYGWVLPFDADGQLTHMNNSRVLREYDCGRFDYWTRSGLMNHLVKGLIAGENVAIMVVGNTVRYRLPLYMFTKYKLVTKAVYWEGKTLYNEQAMYTTKDGIMRNIGYTKAIFPFNVDEFVERNHPGVVKPKIPDDLEAWIRYNESNAIKCRAGKEKFSEKEKHNGKLINNPTPKKG